MSKNPHPISNSRFSVWIRTRIVSHPRVITENSTRHTSDAFRSLRILTQEHVGRHKSPFLKTQILPSKLGYKGHRTTIIWGPCGRGK